MDTLLHLLPTLLHVVGVAAVVVLLGLLGRALWSWAGRGERRQRNEAMSAVATKIGLGFSADDDGSLPARLDGFDLFYKGGSLRRISNVLHGEAKGIEVAIFDYMYSEGGPNGRLSYAQTVVCFWSEALKLPRFSLRPEGVWDRIGSMLGCRDIDVTRYPVFSRNYVLQGMDEDAVRAAFTDPVLSFYESTPGLSTEGKGNCLLYYKFNSWVEPEEVLAFMEEGFRVFGLFASG